MILSITEASHFDPYGDGQVVTAAVTADGEMWVHAHDFAGDAKAAAALAMKVEKAGKINTDHWIFHRAIYGSPAYEREEAEACAWADEIRAGRCSLDDVPSQFQSML